MRALFPDKRCIWLFRWVRRNSDLWQRLPRDMIAYIEQFLTREMFKCWECKEFRPMQQLWVGILNQYMYMSCGHHEKPCLSPSSLSLPKRFLFGGWGRVTDIRVMRLVSDYIEKWKKSRDYGDDRFLDIQIIKMHVIK